MIYILIASGVVFLAANLVLYLFVRLFTAKAAALLRQFAWMHDNLRLVALGLTWRPTVRGEWNGWPVDYRVAHLDPRYDPEDAASARTRVRVDLPDDVDAARLADVELPDPAVVAPDATVEDELTLEDGALVFRCVGVPQSVAAHGRLLDRLTEIASTIR